MLFNSIEFAIFLPVVFLLYWFVFNRNLRWQNLFIVAASYFFYGWWDWRFLILMIASSMVDFYAGLALWKENEAWKRKLILTVCLSLNLGLLGFFKYYNFFADSLSDAFSLMGYKLQVSSLRIVLPVGISFYTFQTMSYTLDVFRRKLEPTRDLITYSAFVSFFPQLVAGPIERAGHLLPQYNKMREFSYPVAVDGLRQILWGLFKKIVIADNCAPLVDQVFQNDATHTGSSYAVGALLFAFQIYCDFSGYSDIALGTARLFGFSLMRNFAYPYFSRDMAEFWRRWHISLSSWFRDYVYIPLGGNNGSLAKRIRNVSIVFLLSGFWHGANWTFIIWGAINAICFIPLLAAGQNRRHLDIVAEDRLWPSFREALSMLGTFLLVTLGWIFFRADSVQQALGVISGIFSTSLFSVPDIEGKRKLLMVVAFIVLTLMLEWRGRRLQHPFEQVNDWSPVLRRATYYAMILVIYFLGGSEKEFIYFQF